MCPPGSQGPNYWIFFNLHFHATIEKKFNLTVFLLSIKLVKKFQIFLYVKGSWSIDHVTCLLGRVWNVTCWVLSGMKFWRLSATMAFFLLTKATTSYIMRSKYF